MKVLSLLLLFGYCLIGISPIRQRTEKDFDIFVDPKSVQIQDRDLIATFSFITIFDDSCSINDAYGSCSASCGVGKAVCKNATRGLATAMYLPEQPCRSTIRRLAVAPGQVSEPKAAVLPMHMEVAA